MSDAPPVRRLGRRTIFENRVWRVFADHIADTNGAHVPDYLVFEAKAHPAGAVGGVAVLPVLADGRVVLLRNWRPAIDGWSFEVAKGFVDAGETPARAAMRELAEETGLACAPEDLLALGEVHAEPAAMTSKTALFLARNCREIDGHTRDENEAGLGRLYFVLPDAAEIHAPSDAVSLLLLARHAHTLRSFGSALESGFDSNSETL
jgi:8-oxo-dGTP pyrophosphatase MutT (NUDIX family)